MSENKNKDNFGTVRSVLHKNFAPFDASDGANPLPAQDNEATKAGAKQLDYNKAFNEALKKNVDLALVVCTQPPSFDRRSFSPNETSTRSRRQKSYPRYIDRADEEWVDKIPQRIRFALIEASKNNFETSGDAEARLMEGHLLRGHRLTELERISVCECDDGRFPGLILAMAPNGNTDYAWVARCDTCAIFESDDHAACFAGRVLGFEVGFARFDASFIPRPYLIGLTFEEAQLLNNRKN